MNRLDLKAIGYGFATFVACTLLMSLVGTVVGAEKLPSIGGTRLAVIRIVGYLAPVVAGFISAKKAPHDRVLNGTIGGSVGVLLQLAPALFFPGYQFRAIPIILAWYAAFASLGAIFGKYWAERVGP